MSDDKLKNELELKLKNFSNIQIVNWQPDDQEGCLLREIAWYNISRNSAKPESKINFNEDTAAWLKSCLEKMSIQSECLLNVGGVGNLPWLKIKVEKDWLEELWLEEKEFMLLYQNKAFGFIEDEYHYEFHQSEIEALGAQKSSYLRMREENRKKIALLKEKNLQS